MRTRRGTICVQGKARAACALVMLLAIIGSSSPWLVSGAWGPSGNVVPNFVDPGLPPSCLPPYSRIDLDKEYDVFDKLLFNQIIALAVSVSFQSY